MTFEERLKALELTKSGLARLIGYSSQQVSRWGNKPPKVVLEYLKMVEAQRELRPKLYKAIDEVFDGSAKEKLD